MKTPILSASLLLLMTGSLLALTQGTNSDATAASAAGVLARLAAARQAAEATAAGAPAAAAPAPVASAAPTTPPAAVTPMAPAPGTAPSVIVPPAPIVSAASASSPPGFTDFQIIARRNIFDPNRQPWVTNRPPLISRPVARVDEFEFRSASLKVGMGYTAFFVGYGVPRGGEVHTNDVFNGYKVKRITLTNVTLVDIQSSNVVTMNEQSGLTRQDGGPWKWTMAPTTYPAPVRVDRVQAQPDYSQPQPFAAGQPFAIRTFSPPDDGSGNTDLTGFNGGRQGRRNRNGNGGGFGNNGGGFQTQPDTTPAPLSPVDAAAAAAAEARMRARRAQEN